MPFNILSYINYTKQVKNVHKYMQHNEQGWPFLPSRDLIVARLTRDGRVHNVHSPIETNGHRTVVIYYMN